MSCEACHIRKIKCVRASGPDSNCARCTKKNIPCVTTLKRASSSLSELTAAKRLATAPSSSASSASSSASSSSPPAPAPNGGVVKARTNGGLPIPERVVSGAGHGTLNPPGLEERFALLRHVGALMERLSSQFQLAEVKSFGLWRAPLPDESMWPTLPLPVLFRDYARGSVLARMLGDTHVEELLLAAARPMSCMLYDKINDVNVVHGFHMMSKLMMKRDMNLAMHLGRMACSLTRSLTDPNYQLGGDECKLATTMLQFTLIRLFNQGLPFSLGELEYVLRRPEPPVVDPASAQSVYTRLQYELFITKVEMARCCSLVAVIFGRDTPSPDMLQTPRIDNVPADSGATQALRSRITQLTAIIDHVYKHKVELGLEGAWGYHNGLLHRVFMWYLLDEYDKAMNDARHLASFFGRYEAFFSSIPNQTTPLLFHACHLPILYNDEATFHVILHVLSSKAHVSDYCKLAVPILQEAWDQYAPNAAAVSLASLASAPLVPSTPFKHEITPSTGMSPPMPSVLINVSTTPEWSNVSWLNEPFPGDDVDPLFAIILDA